MRFGILWAGAILATGCAGKREAAPEELEELAAFMFQHWDDARTMEDAMENLNAFLEVQVDSNEAEEGWRLTPLGQESISTVDGPDNPDLSMLLGAAVAARSAFEVDAHARTLVLPDQVFSNPSNYLSYSRELTGGDEAAFLAGEDESMITTVNDVTTSNFGVQVPYILFKDYRWVQPRGQEPSVVARAWIAEPGCNDGGGNCLLQSWSVDVFAGREQGSLRFTSTWTEIDSSLNGVISENVRIRALANGMQQVFISTEEFIEEGGG